MSYLRIPSLGIWILQGIGKNQVAIPPPILIEYRIKRAPNLSRSGGKKITRALAVSSTIETRRHDTIHNIIIILISFVNIAIFLTLCFRWNRTVTRPSASSDRRSQWAAEVCETRSGQVMQSCYVYPFIGWVHYFVPYMYAGRLFNAPSPLITTLRRPQTSPKPEKSVWTFNLRQIYHNTMLI